MKHVPWHVKGIDPEARQVARHAARRSGLSVGRWLNSLIIDAAAAGRLGEGYDAPVPSRPAVAPHTTVSSNSAPRPSTPAEQHHPIASVEDSRFSSLAQQIEGLTLRIERLMQSGDERHAGPEPRSQSADERHALGSGGPDRDTVPRVASTVAEAAFPNMPHAREAGWLEPEPATPQPAAPTPHLADTIARIDRQLEAMRRTPSPFGPPEQSNTVDPEPSDGVDEAFAEIAARQKALELEPAAPDPADAGAGRQSLPQIDGAMLDRRLRDIEEQLKTLQPSARPDGIAAAAAPGDDAASSIRSIEALEEQLRRLADRIEAAPAPVAVEQAVDSLRRDFGDIGRRLEEALPRYAATALQDPILALKEEIAKLGAPPRADENTDLLRAELSEIRDALKCTGPHRDGPAIEQQLRAIAQEVAELHARPRADGTAEALSADLAELRAAIKEPVPPGNAGSIEEQLRLIAQEVAGLHPPLRAEEVAAALRRDLDELGAALRDRMPHDAVSAIEQQIQALHSRIADLPAPLRAEDIAEALRSDLAELGNTVRSAVPAAAIATLETEVRMLGERIEATRALQPENPASSTLEFDLTEIRDRLRAMSATEGIAALDDSIRTLSREADSIAGANPPPDILRQLESALATLHDITSRATPDALAALSRDIQALSAKIDSSEQHRTPDYDVLTSLERRLAEMAEAIGHRPSETPAVPQGLESTIERLADWLESAQIPTADLAALRDLDQRFAGFAEKLDASEAQLCRLDGVERGIGDLLVQLKELRAHNERKLQAIQQQMAASAAAANSAPAEAIGRDVAMLKEIQSAADRRTQDTFEAVYGTVEQVVDRLATIEQGLRDREAARTAAVLNTAPAFVPDGPPIAPPPVAGPMPERTVLPAEHGTVPGKAVPAAASAVSSVPASSAAARPPLITDLPPDAPLEPGSGARRARMVANAIERIAASEAANTGAGAKPADSLDIVPSRANFVAAARRAAQAVAGEQAPAAPADKAASETAPPSRVSRLMGKFGPRIKSVILGISVILLVLGALRLALDLFYAPEAAVPQLPAPATGAQTPPADAARPDRGAALDTPVPAAPSAAAILAEAALPAVPAPAGSAPIPVPPSGPDTTGQLALPQAPQERTAAAPGAAPAASAPRELAPLPVAIGGKVLLDAAAAGEPDASFEVATRFAEGRNVPQDLAQAAAWFDRAARRGLAPAQFRLGSMYEKGLGLKKDLQEARRLYLAAADKGNAKAMHNLAVLYAEGLDGKPDYAIASQWFRKAATFGIVDSQYNLAILYARGIGVDHSLTESYKWFALAAKGGDKDAAKKRDEIAMRLDSQQLEATKQAVEAFVAERQPEEATVTKAPPGGWDEAVAAPAKRKPSH